MENQHLRLGKIGEATAVKYLQEQGYKIICENYHSGLGEIDIIARDKDTIAFVEVKSRTSSKFGFPQESIGVKKQNQIIKAALIYIKKERIAHTNLRFDVVAICGSVIELIKNAFPLDKRYIY